MVSIVEETSREENSKLMCSSHLAIISSWFIVVRILWGDDNRPVLPNKAKGAVERRPCGSNHASRQKLTFAPSWTLRLPAPWKNAPPAAALPELPPVNVLRMKLSGTPNVGKSESSRLASGVL